MMEFINIAGYKFVSLEQTSLVTLKQQLLQQAKELNLKGTVLLAEEGINFFLAGLYDSIAQYMEFLAQFPEFSDLTYKQSVSDSQPFTRMLVRIKKEIISMGCPEIKPSESKAPYVSAEELKEWYDSGRDMVILDTRNDYEVALGTFEKAIDLNIETFRAFPDVVKQLPADMKEKTIVTFCTGGIRCEKAAAYLQKQGYKNVYQLEGGILKYLEKCGQAHYEGECFVFDKRVALDADLNETVTQQCFACRMPLPLSEQQPDGVCPYCGGNAMTGEKEKAVEAQESRQDGIV